MTDNIMSILTPRAQAVLELSRKEASRLNHGFVSSEHLLLAIFVLGQGTAFNVLQKQGLNLKDVCNEVKKQACTEPDNKTIGCGPFTARVKTVLDVAAEETRTLNHTYVGTEHLLLGILRETDGVAARVLKHFNVDIETTRRQILEEADPNAFFV